MWGWNACQTASGDILQIDGERAEVRALGWQSIAGLGQHAVLSVVWRVLSGHALSIAVACTPASVGVDNGQLAVDTSTVEHASLQHKWIASRNSAWRWSGGIDRSLNLGLEDVRFNTAKVGATWPQDITILNK